jgi:hypothetical protein
MRIGSVFRRTKEGAMIAIAGLILASGVFVSDGVEAGDPGRGAAHAPSDRPEDGRGTLQLGLAFYAKGTYARIRGDGSKEQPFEIRLPLDHKFVGFVAVEVKVTSRTTKLPLPPASHVGGEGP